MANGRHSYVRVFPSDWLAGTARMSRLHRSVYFDVCMYIWDKNAPCPASELPMMLGDLKGWRSYVEDLVDAGKLVRSEDGSLSSDRAKAEAQWAFDQWHKRSFGGKGGRNSLSDTDASSDAKSLVKTDDGELPRYNQNQNQNDVGKPTSSATKRGSRLSDQWAPSMPYPERVMALVAQWPPGRADRELDQFCAYWTSLAGKGAAKLDWDKTWHNRIRDQHDRIMRENFNGQRNGQSVTGYGRTVDALADFVREADAGDAGRLR